jgi:hypothetical protein
MSTFATGINNFGEIVGYYFDAVGREHGLLASPGPIPEPCTLLLVAIATLGLSAFVWWRWLLGKRLLTSHPAILGASRKQTASGFGC